MDTYFTSVKINNTIISESSNIYDETNIVEVLNNSLKHFLKIINIDSNNLDNDIEIHYANNICKKACAKVGHSTYECIAIKIINN